MGTPHPAAGEVSTHKVAAVFDSTNAAESAAARVRQSLSLGDAQVQVIRPGERHPGRKLEPESRGIWQTMLRTHLILGLAGVVAGALLFYLLYASGVRFIVASPVAAALAIMFFGGLAGAMLGGLVTLRPDHDAYIVKVLEACREGRSAVVVHAFDSKQRDSAQALLADIGGDVLGTL